MKLFHFTCWDHGHNGIGQRGLVKPQHKRTLGGISHMDLGVAWFTTGDFASTGMDMSGFYGPAACDRSAYRYIVTDDTTCANWLGSQYRKLALVEVADIVTTLEGVGDPTKWYVSAFPVPVRLG